MNARGGEPLAALRPLLARAAEIGFSHVELSGKSLAVAALGDEAARHGVRIALENVDPVGIYIAQRAYGLRLDRLAEQVAQVDHPQVGVCLDVGHAFLAAIYLDDDFLPTVRGIAPLVTHLHLSDNLGRTQLDGEVDIDERLALGDGDLHLVPGWGVVPLPEVFAIPFPHDPIVILELRPHFSEHFPEALRATQELTTLQSIARRDAAAPV